MVAVTLSGFTSTWPCETVGGGQGRSSMCRADRSHEIARVLVGAMCSSAPISFFTSAHSPMVSLVSSYAPASLSRVPIPPGRRWAATPLAARRSTIES